MKSFERSQETKPRELITSLCENCPIGNISRHTYPVNPGYHHLKIWVFWARVHEGGSCGSHLFGLSEIVEKKILQEPSLLISWLACWYWLIQFDAQFGRSFGVEIHVVHLRLPVAPASSTAPKRKVYCSKHQFSSAKLLVSRRVYDIYIYVKMKNIYMWCINIYMCIIFTAHISFCCFSM